MRSTEVIVIDDSDSDTLSESERPSLASKPPLKGQSLPIASTSAAGLATIVPDRAQLERERRQRAQKRRRDQGLQDSETDELEEHDDKRSKGQDTAETPLLTPWESATAPVSATSRYWNGTIKHGFNTYVLKSKRGTSIADIVLPATKTSRNGLQLVVLATYDLRMDWLYAQFPRELPVTLVLPPGDGDYRKDKSITPPGLHSTENFAEFKSFVGWNICVPNKPKGGWLTQHMKFIFLVHDTFLRIAILSGNLNDIDWNRIENTAYIQDFPLLKSTQVEEPKSSGLDDSFKFQILEVLRSLSLPRFHPMFAAIDKYDFTAATRAQVIASWPEPNMLSGWNQMESQGLGRLGKLARSYNMGCEDGKEGVQLECQGSSLSAHDRKWLEHFHLLASGYQPRNRLPFRGKPDETHPGYHYANGSKAGSLPPIKICFPTQRYVETQTVEGPIGAASFFGKADTYKNSLVKGLYCSPKSRRGDVMIHAKSILALTAEGKAVVDKAFEKAQSGTASSTLLALTPAWKPVPGEKAIGWTYMGSSNFTRAAHGNISGSAAKPAMSSRNWELGVMMPIYASEVEAFGVEAECLRAIVYQRPVTPYAASDTPWDQSSIRL